ncbi:conserved hypothetical protein [Talaromyces stipitatus ATCC 10500]|uniref:Geranylgeranyl pyrophosphate synthetase n=1 Tax=Talaromyces stipitatus (strain ATCC 10500 / CBS 375.48 / QM 6759 / NRRL 1006) TaxID=441959 RepID=B8LUG6_TALSN|nr:uncharacterized protein TSTA_071360 [Talaromyces stipitatus ATCC 10500]EED23739.1 conserved hypothetical protein [Talaromyces stipitatus ATCC 10500]
MTSRLTVSRGRSSGRWRNGRGSRQPSVLPTPAPPLGDVLATIQHDDLENHKTDDQDCPQITNAQYLTSYNWLNGADHEILVPGEPPAWTPLSKPTKLPADSGLYYRDKNAARYPTYPLEPMVRAIRMDKPDFHLEELDIVGCRSTLGNLLRFTRGQSNPFRMLVEVVGNTVFFIRRENSPTETIPNVQGYGHTFPESYTTWSESARRSESHQRLITYDFAGMNCLVRFEADGYLPDLIPDSLRIQKESVSNKSEIEPDDLLSAIEASTISPIPSVTTDTETTALQISEKGRYVPQCAIFDLKTRSAKKSGVDTFSEEAARLWIRQIPNFILAYHKFGTFDDIRVQDVRDELKQWEESHQPELVKFATLLKMVVSFTRSTEDGKLEIEHEENAKELNLRRPGGVVNGVLPSSLINTIWGSE